MLGARLAFRDFDGEIAHADRPSKDNAAYGFDDDEAKRIEWQRREEDDEDEPRKRRAAARCDRRQDREEHDEPDHRETGRHEGVREPLNHHVAIATVLGVQRCVGGEKHGGEQERRAYLDVGDAPDAKPDEAATAEGAKDAARGEGEASAAFEGIGRRERELREPRDAEERAHAADNGERQKRRPRPVSACAVKGAREENRERGDA